MKLLALLFAVLLTGCASVGQTMVMERNVTTSTITWVDKVPERCGLTVGGLNGCAEWASDFSWCVMTLLKSSPDWLIAHEVKHCFGWVHWK